MRKKIGIAVAVAFALLLIGGVRAGAHHSVAAEFDVSKEVLLTGTLTKFDLVNPHSWFYVDVTGPDGTVTAWRLESLTPNILIRQGLKIREDFKVGGTYTFRIAPAKKDPTLGFMKAVTVNGKEYSVIEL